MRPTTVRERPRPPMPPDRLIELLIYAAILLVVLIAIVVGVT